MKPMQPMKPMEPMDVGTAWWPEELGHPSTSGGQDGIKYAFFADRHRLAIEKNGTVSIFDSGDHRVSGVQQRQGAASSLEFTSQNGTVHLDDLQKV